MKNSLVFVLQVITAGVGEGGGGGCLGCNCTSNSTIWYTIHMY